MVVLFLLITTALGFACAGKRKLGIILFCITLLGCALMLYHVATTPLKINL